MMQHTVRLVGLFRERTIHRHPVKHSRDTQSKKNRMMTKRNDDTAHMCVTVDSKMPAFMITHSTFFSLAKMLNSYVLQFISVCVDECVTGGWETHPRSFHRFYDSFFFAVDSFAVTSSPFLSVRWVFIWTRFYNNLCVPASRTYIFISKPNAIRCLYLPAFLWQTCVRALLYFAPLYVWLSIVRALFLYIWTFFLPVLEQKQSLFFFPLSFSFLFSLFASSFLII